MINTMKHYYLINNTIKKGSKMPVINEEWHTYNANLLKWSESLQPCEISESEIMKIYVHLFPNLSYNKQDATPIDVTDIVEEKVTHQLLSMPPINCYELFFKQPKQVDGEIEAVEFAEWILKNEWISEPKTWYRPDGWGIHKTTKQLYEIFKNRK